MARISDVTAAAENLWPLSGADDWDRPGLVAGAFHAKVEKVLLAVDVTLEVIRDAIDGEFQMVISHHPFLLKGATSVAENTGKGSVLALAIKHDIALYAAHTNADITATGVSATLANAFGLEGASPLMTTSSSAIGHGRIGNLAAPMTLIDFARRVAATLPATAAGIRVAGMADQRVERVALCGGAGDAFLGAALQAHADVYVTSDLRHHPAQDILAEASAQGRELALIDISHWAAESLWLEVAANELANALPSVKFEVSDLRTDSWDFAVTQ